MPTPPSLIGRWNIESMDMWDSEAMNLVEQAHITFTGDGGEMVFICVNVTLDCRTKGVGVEFTFEGDDEGDRVSGRGHAKVVKDKLQGWICLHQGDESGFVARRAAG